MSKYSHMRRRQRLQEQPELYAPLYMRNDGMAYAQEALISQRCLSFSLRLSAVTAIVVVLALLYFLITLFQYHYSHPHGDNSGEEEQATPS